MEFQTAWITGATSGIGLALAQRLMARGTKVYSVSRHPEKAPKHELFHSFQLDLSDLSAVTSFLDRFSDEFDTPDLFVNNAGYGAFYEWQNFTPENILAQTNALFTSSALFCQAIASSNGNHQAWYYSKSYLACGSLSIALHAYL